MSKEEILQVILEFFREQDLSCYFRYFEADEDNLDEATIDGSRICLSKLAEKIYSRLNQK